MADILGSTLVRVQKLFKDIGGDAHAETVAIAAGAEIVGQVSIDQTTPGTTDSVSVATGQGAGAVIGAATTDAAVVTDATGTIHQYLRGLVKLIAAKIGVTVADGDNAVLGTTTAAKVITDASGTVQQYLRGIVHLLISIISVKIDQTTPGTTNKVWADPVTATPVTYNVTLTVADTEYSQAMPANCRAFEFQARTDVAIRAAFVTGHVAGPAAPWITLKAGDYYYSFDLNQEAAPSTLYLGSAIPGTIVEIIAWV